MSLTFDFPEWQLSVSSRENKKELSENPPNSVHGDAGTDWAADLAELDGGDDERSTAADRAPPLNADHNHRPADVQPQFDPESPAWCPTSRRSGRSIYGHVHWADGEGEISCTSRQGVGVSGRHDTDREGAPSSLAAVPSDPRACGPTPSDDPGANPVGLQPGAGVGPRAVPGPSPGMVSISGDAIPSEMLLLVLSGLRDVGDCVRAALVCKHWLAVVTLSNELWYELDSIQLASGTWHRQPHAGRPLLRPPPGCDHPHSKMLSYKTTCALTQVAVRFMALRKGFEYVVEAAASLWLAAQRAAVGPGGRHPGSPRDPQPGGEPPRHHTECSRDAAVGSSQAETEAEAASQAEWAEAAEVGADSTVGSGGSGDGWGGRRRRITHVDQLWESCGRSRAALQVDERFNAVRVQQMVGKLCSSGGSTWVPLYEGLAAVMSSRCDQIRDQLAAVAATARDGAAAAAMAVPSPSSGSKRLRGAAAWLGGGGGGGGQGLARNSPPPQRPPQLHPQTPKLFRGEVVYGGGSYADQFAELLRRGDTRGALALGGPQRGAAAGAGATGDGGGGGFQWELDEPEMREVVMLADDGGWQECAGGSSTAPRSGGNGGGGGGPTCVEARVAPILAEGLLLWRQLLRSWAVYRRWLEVWVVWCGPLGARLEAERQLAGAAAAHGDAALAPPHLTNKGLALFRSQVVLAYPLRRPLQAAALWLSARAARGREDDAGGGGGGGGGGLCHDDEGPGLSEEHGQLLTEIRKLLTELAVPDDATQPPPLQTRQKLQRCFGELLLRPVGGGGRALQMAQRLHGLRAAAAAAGGSGGGGGRACS